MEKHCKVNYMHEINEFYRWIDIYPLPGTAISLWHAFMSINNRVRWSKTFTASLQTLSEKSGFERKALLRARKILTEAGRIRWVNKGSNAACYELIHFTEKDFEISNDELFDNQSDDVYNEEKDSENEENNSSQLNLFPESDKASPESNNTSQSILEGEKIDEEVSLEGPLEGPLEVPLKVSLEGLINNNTLKSKHKTKDSFSFSEIKKINSTQVFQFYNQICKNLRPAKTLNNARKSLIQRRLKEYGAEKVIQMLQNAAISDHLAGKNNIGWIANIDWIFSATHFIKILEGDYCGLSGSFNQQKKEIDKPSPLEILNVCYNQITNDEERS